MQSILRSLLGLGLVVLWVVQSSPLVDAQSLGSVAGRKQNLDLPFDAGVFDGEDSEEDAPETIRFYGQQYEGDGVFFVIDRSGSMQNKGELRIAKQEVIKNINDFTSRVEFGIVFFDSQILKYPSGGRPATSNPAMKASGLNFVTSVAGGSGSCMQKGFVEVLKFANLSTAKRKVIIYVGDGAGSCAGHQAILSMVKSQNYQRAQVNTIGVLDVEGANERFLRQLAGSNGGSYTYISR